jgi:ubiquinol-cytochrome c reductase cytochrome c subunit
MPRLRTVALVLLAGGALLTVVPSVVAVPLAPAMPLNTPPLADAAAGRNVYVARCASCHGADGSGTDQGPSLIGVGAAAADFELRTGRMPFTGPPGTQAVRKPPAFDDQTIRDLDDYVASLGPGPAIPTPKVDMHTISAGQRLFVANCAPCHGATANGGAVGGGALAPPLDKATPVEVAEAMLIGPGQMPVFSNYSDEQGNAIVSYVSYVQESIHPGGFSIGGVGPVPEGFVAWVFGLGLLLIIVVLIGRDWRERAA